jgi:hypothetical protein
VTSVLPALSVVNPVCVLHLDVDKEFLDKLSKHERLQVLCDEVEQLPVAHLAVAANFLHNHSLLVDRLGAEKTLKAGKNVFYVCKVITQPKSQAQKL